LSNRQEKSAAYGAFLAALSGALFGLMGFLGTRLLQLHYTVGNMLFWRFCVATLWMLMATLLWKKKLVKKLNKQALIQTLGIAAFLYSAGSSLYFLSSQFIGTGLAMALFFSFPIFVALFSCFFSRWRMDGYTFISLIAMVIGIILLKDEHATQANVHGVMLALLSAFFYATYVYRSRAMTKNINPHLLTLLVCMGNMLIFFVYSCTTHNFIFPTALNAWLYICALGVLATALPIQLLLDSLKYISPVKASILTTLELVVTLLMGWLLLDEQVTLLQMAGVVVLLTGAILIQLE
jgi:drug/metabolite transporter (DMT)-like permease